MCDDEDHRFDTPSMLRHHRASRHHRLDTVRRLNPHPLHFHRMHKVLSSMNKKSASTFTTRASGIVLLPLVCLLAVTLSADAFVLPNNAAVTVVSSNRSSRRHFQLFMTSALAPNSSPDDIVATKKLQLKSQIRKEGGLFAFNTKFGALNPYAVWYGVTSIALGLFWFVALIGCELLYKVTNGRVDKLKRLPAFFSQIWGESLLKVALVTPELVGKDKLKTFYESNRAAMFVANHNSWLDIPFIGHTIGWRNYKLVSKAELGKVPILGRAIKTGGHIMVDRTDRKSQLMTLKGGIQLLKDGVHLCTFPEGTRSKSGRLGNFKNGAFKMAHKVGAPVVPVSIVGAANAMPYYWMFPFRPAAGVCKVIVHDPIESIDKTEEELADAVREAIISGLPEDQKPLTHLKSANESEESSS